MKHTLAMLAAGSFFVTAISVAAAPHAAVTDKETHGQTEGRCPGRGVERRDHFEYGR
jgi:hypothetical protein